MDKLQQLSVFRRVVETGNITRAARDLAMSQPSVSRIIGELEQRLGVPLLLRSPRGLAATEAGQLFHAEAVRILDRLEEAEANVRGAQASLAGPVRIACVASFFNQAVLPWLQDFLLANPEVVLEGRLDPKPIDLVGEGIDLAIRFGPIREQSLIARKLGRIDFALFASPSYLARAGLPTTPEELAEHDFCRLNVSSLTNLLTLDGPDGRTVSVEVHGRFSADSVDTINAAARAGLGIALLAPWSVTEEVASGRLVPVLPGWRAEPRDVHAAWPGNHSLPRRVRAILDILIEKTSAEPRLKAR
ncbi:LysR family transcriptional regulator [Belnapia rosea]|jgi:DNA-binding transcriptional LysR family regulator|uniref:DNA-binding transcriptional regulator, LysR family n=1 Tax=Belnapia rosea TaxID=938405 RepID=A0A1G6QHC0_9PROT|nr:LysR family transcriptional regulator [Belnapia rosea]SDB64619.1 DNA-binding transcriptional regulator, LysR family [Belnapia rosea]SDC91324.1 DNA-binding transcriptional regulator, LysR family [Belnapia rosea]